MMGMQAKLKVLKTLGRRALWVLMSLFKKLNIHALYSILIVSSCNAPKDNSMSCAPSGHYYSHIEVGTLYIPLISESKYIEYVIYPDLMIVLDNKGMDYRSIRSSNDSLFVYYPSGIIDVYHYKCAGENLVLRSTTDLAEKVLIPIQSVNKPYEEIRNSLAGEFYEKRRDSILNRFFEKHE